jgi:hypothetical protein
VHWRLSRQPSVLWRAVVLSSGGLILLWVLLMTLFLPDLNYSKSYAGVAQQIAGAPAGRHAAASNQCRPAPARLVRLLRRLPFAGVEGGKCSYLLLQDSVKLQRRPWNSCGLKRKSDGALIWTVSPAVSWAAWAPIAANDNAAATAMLNRVLFMVILQ